MAFEDELICVYCQGDDFNRQVDSCKYLGMTYDSTKHCWTISPGKLNEVIVEIQDYQISISDYDKMELQKYLNNLKELKQITKRSEYRHFKPELMLKQPL